jgi:serine/threonine protein kinase
MSGGEAPMPRDRRGQRFGDYVVEALIGRGGMGVVFRARHRISGRIVALKLMAPDLADNHSFRDRFVREAEAGPSLNHPNIVPVLESGEADGELFIAMELVDGTDLKGLIQREGPLEPKRVLSIFRQVASALDAAHESGMVHRDVKPQNILVVPRENPEGADRVYLTDFGLVRPVTSESSASRSGHVFGSVAYMAPELIEGIPTDGRADVYALGCVLYECLTGSVPFERDNEVSAAWAHVHEDPPLLTDTSRDLPGGLNDVVLKAMAKHPDDRFLTCGEFVAELERGLGRRLSTLKYRHVRPLVTRIPRRKNERDVWSPNFFPELARVRKITNKPNWFRVAGVIAVVLLVPTLIQFFYPKGVTGAVQDVADAGKSVVGAVTDSDPEPQPGNKRSGSEVAQKDGDPRGAVERRGRIAGPDRERLEALLPPADPPQAGPNDPPDPAVARSESPGRIAWARGDVGGLTGTTPTDIWVMDADGSNKIRLTATASADEVYPSWSPDGRHIAYVRMSNGGPQEIWVMDANGANQRDLGLCPGDANCGKLAWAPNGRRVAYVQGTDLHVADLTTGTSRRLVSGLTSASRPGGAGGPGPTWSPNGRLLAFTCGDALCVVAARGGKSRAIGPAFADPEWSPSGQWLVGEYSGGGSYEGANIFLIRPDGTDRRQLTTATGPQGARKPTWAADGRSLVYTDWSTGAGLLFRIDVDGSGRAQLTSGPDDYTPDWWGPSE